LNPITGALEFLINDEAVKQSIENLVLTQRGERFYHLDVGSDVQKSLFDPIDNITIVNIQTSITNTIKKYEPRAQNVQVSLEVTNDNNGYVATIVFSMINIPGNVQSMQLNIPRIR
jgi:phage baseplate assembly protein W